MMARNENHKAFVINQVSERQGGVGKVSVAG